jgi:hypothetical protein
MVTDGHETPFSSVNEVPGGNPVAGGCIVQAEPSQRKMNATAPP